VNKAGGDAARAAAQKKAEELLARAKAGEDFAALATASSEDPGSATKGGDLGLFPRGRMAPPFETAAFALQPGALSDVVETPYGFHIIKVEEHRAGGVRPLDSVRDAIVDTIKKERALELARRQAEADRRKVAHGTPFAELGRQIAETPPFAADADVPGVGRVKEFTDATLALGEGQASDLIETDEAIYLLTPFARVESHIPTLDVVRARVEDDVRRLVWSIVGGRLTHHNGSVQVFAAGPNASRFVWTTDLLPDALAPSIEAMMAQAMPIIQATLGWARPGRESFVLAK